MLTVTAKIKSRIYYVYVPPRSNKKYQTLAACNVLSVMMPEHTNVLLWCLSGVRLWRSTGKTSLFIQTKAGRLQTAPEPILISFINLQLPPLPFYFVIHKIFVRFFQNKRVGYDWNTSCRGKVCILIAVNWKYTTLICYSFWGTKTIGL